MDGSPHSNVEECHMPVVGLNLVSNGRHRKLIISVGTVISAISQSVESSRSSSVIPMTYEELSRFLHFGVELAAVNY